MLVFLREQSQDFLTFLIKRAEQRMCDIPKSEDQGIYWFS